MSKWGGPVNPYYTLGGFIPAGESFPENPEYHKETKQFNFKVLPLNKGTQFCGKDVANDIFQNMTFF